MKKTALALAAICTLMTVPAALQAKAKLTPQQQLDKLLEGRVAGKPVSCLSSSAARVAVQRRRPRRRATHRVHSTPASSSDGAGFACGSVHSEGGA